MNLNTELYKKASMIMPGGVSSPVRAFKAVGGNPPIIRSANGPKIRDVNDNVYLDYCMSFGPLIIGHAHPHVVSELKNAINHGTSYGLTNENEIRLAERIIKHYEQIDWIRFVNSGTEAVMSAIRLARAVTNREMIIKFDGCYHGHSDSLLVNAGSGLATFGISSSMGVPN
ncbi:MAG: aminotransferase class III-fold pyridoxal phosphate-dependent enzyme, partial [Candidatus Thorarchaeota archaeon]